MKIYGHYLSGKTSRKTLAYLEVGQMTNPSIQLYIADDNGHHRKQSLTFNDFKIESRLGNTPRELTFGNAELFITDDNDAIDTLINQCCVEKNISLLHRLESNLFLVVLALVVTLAFIWSFVVYGIPSSAKTIAENMPTFATEKLGSGLTMLDQTVFNPSKLDETRQQEIQQLVAPYIKKYQHLNPQLYFRSGMKANALALPGGEIVFTDDFVELAQNNEQLLAVFFHELGHLKHNHITRRILQDSMITLMVILITGDVDTIDLLTGFPALILDLSYSREFEVEADTYALEQMHNVNIPLENFATIMQSLDDFYSPEKNSDEDLSEFKLPDFLSTHPATTDRIMLAKKLIKKYQDESVK